MTDQPRAVLTNGKGEQTTQHLNLTRSLADAPKELRQRENKDHRKVGYAGREIQS